MRIAKMVPLMGVLHKIHLHSLVCVRGGSQESVYLCTIGMLSAQHK